MCCPFMSTMTDFIDLMHGKRYMPHLAARDCDFKLLFCFEEENLQWLENLFLGTSQETREVTGSADTCSEMNFVSF